MDNIQEAFAASDRYFPTQLQKFQFYDKYSRFNYELGRRETWIETVLRAVDYLKELSNNSLPDEDYRRIYEGILQMKVMPSMRLLAMAGPAAKRNNLCLYNCSYMPVNSLKSFTEALLISMCGCGVGFSVESRYVAELPPIKAIDPHAVSYHTIEDSAEGWVEALRVGLESWFDGRDVEFNYSLVRVAGSPLKTKGGRASGPEPLKKMLDFARETILAKSGDRLSTLEAHDLMCEIGNAAVSGGVRRTAMLSLFDFNDEAMLQSKEGLIPVRRWNANNSVVWPDRKLTQAEIIDWFMAMSSGGNGEPGLFNRRAINKTKPSRRAEAVFGTNPCAEIVLRPQQLCNLSSVVCRAGDDYESLMEKVELATIIGTIQSMATHFPGLSDEWRKNCEEERLLGVDLNGQMDCIAVQNPLLQTHLRHHAVAVNARYAELLGINQSACVTTCKPSGNSSVLLDCASGIHERFAEHYIRNVRVGYRSPVYKVLVDAGLPIVPENGQDWSNVTTCVVSFPVAAPRGAVVKGTHSAVEQLDYWKQVKTHYTEHNPSVTITYKPDEYIDIIKWLYNNQEIIGGISFLPHSEATYTNMPYVPMTKEEYLEAVSKFPTIDFSRLHYYELTDSTTAAQELACVAGYCEV